MSFKELLKNLPEVRQPTEKKLSFNVKLKWTLIVLISFFILSNIALYGLESNALERFEYLAIIMGTSFGSIISLGIGPIVMASIILQLLVGSGIVNIDTSTPEGKKFFGGLQKLMVFAFVIFEALIYVLMGGLRAMPGYTLIVIIQLIVGGLVIVFMDELVTKWGFGSGTSLFIAAGVGWRLFNSLFSFLDTSWNFNPTGAIISFIISIINVDTTGAVLALIAILITTALFLIIVWAQSLKIEIPLSYDRLRGYSFKWPLQFFYASVIPVILTAALIANLQLFAGILQNWLGHPTFLGNIGANGQAESGFLFWVGSTNIVNAIITKSFRWIYLIQTLGHILFYMFFAALFSVFWVKTAGMDASSQANNILKSGLQIPGFRKDERILESMLSRYIMPLTIMGGMAIGLLSALADISGALVGGTSLLLGIMIIFQLYQNIAQQHSIDMNPSMKKMMGI
ncbi:MAG: preprotein translocase subunit SecY [Candidatus Nanoarchaeia archaeon]